MDGFLLQECESELDCRGIRLVRKLRRNRPLGDGKKSKVGHRKSGCPTFGLSRMIRSGLPDDQVIGHREHPRDR